MITVLGIINPKSGKGIGSSVAEKTKARFRASAINLELIETKHPGHASEIARDSIQKGYKKILCLGGDGTLYETLNGLFANGPVPDLTIGIVPIGTGNSFLKDFDSHSMNLADKIVQNKTRDCDVIETIHTSGKFYWMNIFSFGFTANVGATRNRVFPNIGTIGYTLSVFLELKKLSSSRVKMKIDSGILETDSTFISINNTRFTGGNMMMAPEAIPDDGLVDIVEVQKMTRMELLQAFPRIFKGTHGALPNVKFHKTKNVEFYFDRPIDIMIDGEMKNIQPTSLKVIPKAIKIYA